MKDLVSIITPSYNCEKFIGATITSVINQTYKNWEMIIVDDCSSDNSINIIKSFNEERIKLSINKTNQGAALSRNKAIKMAKGRWIAFLDSDDLWQANKLEHQIKFMEDNNYHFSYTNYNKIDETSTLIGKIVSGPLVINKRKMRNYCYPGCLTVIYDAKYVGLVQIEDLKKNNDYALWLKVVDKTNCYLLNEVLSSYRIRSGSISNHSHFSLIKYHYILWRNGEKYSKIISLYLTLMNLYFGFIKKVKYEK